MANTPNYNLRKVDYAEMADIPGHFNGNMDTIDAEMKNNADAAAAAEDNAKSHADGLIGTLSELLTTVKTNIVAAINSLKGEVDSHKAESATQTDLGHVRLQENWITATLENGWTGTVKYAKNDLGFVTIRGSLTSGVITAGTTIAAFPYGYTPAVTMPVFFVTNTSATIIKACYIHPSGAIRTAVSNELTESTGYGVSIVYYAG